MIQSTDHTIKPLSECQEHISALAKLWHEEISRHWAPDASIEKAQQKLTHHLNTNSMPIAYAAICDGEAVSMACLRETDGIRPGVTPWLGSLVVSPKYRRCKVGEALISTVKDQAKNLGHQTLYLLAFDPTIPNWYTRLGWTHIGDDKLFGHRVAVMSIPL
ncbi:MAG TPA: GNAT family N-acetyltransferase [Gammaproteobacteria bacterium]|jgi:GNAT superfamily N-acetyltransferase|nr:GNAT family N-acetyltransferase [Gammaproteobacteria bacterium]